MNDQSLLAFTSPGMYGAALRIASVERQRTSRDRRRVDDRRGRLAEHDETVEDPLEVVHRPEVQLHEEAVLARDPVAVDDLGNLSRQLRDLLKLAGRRSNANDCGDWKPDCLRIDFGAVGRDHAGALEPLDALGHSRRREVDAAAELGDRHARIRLQLLEETTVDLVQQLVFVGQQRCTPWLHRRWSENGLVSVWQIARGAVTISFMQQAVAVPARRAGLGRLAATAPPETFFVGSAIFHYLGPAFAVLLFARVEPLGVAWLRIASAAAVFALWRRPWRALKGSRRPVWVLVCSLGAVLAVMNACFYVAIDRLPLGTVAAIEFLPVIGLAALGARSPRNFAALALAVPNALLFAAYIVLAHRVSRHGALSGIDGLAASMLVAAVAVTPIGGW